MSERPRPERPGAGQRRRRGEQKPEATGKEQINQSPLLAVVHELVTAAGVRQAFETEREFHLRLEQEAYMPLVIESWSAIPSYRSEKRHISVAHYYQQGGDTIADPDILMTDSGYPIEIQMPTLLFLAQQTRD
jgi:hypothetical protein